MPDRSSAPAARAALDADDARRQFRQAMAHLGAAVNVVTTAGPHGRCGITASAVCSVTDAPPTLLVCVNRSSAMHAAFLRNRNVCVNVLPSEHELLARHFAGFTGLPMDARFNLPLWDEGAHGVPVLRDALASLQGTIVESKEVGSHAVMFVQAHAIRVRGDGDGLVYFGRAFHRIARPAA
ncbi:4-hydroxyphenylacetate 3-monooxygenase, reductase component [Burkholderia thailandensis]|uniref:4-hydroxyphenylacetate 3-monooxygenase reductase component n=1 Tax=Burkholderia thailandensis (strain ATCC 700388 / DSM 13276 / CCUG 48851 / CIP 106301 / E264) TaxID=271848 RepID=Q2T8I2_BURTA|nr:4-hydroxyphenylacetate 3-monooxygenase, reductase component [Burkholderia thailandensis]ABC35810.1 4-hydroxyphenylacetate 3-monooxygenase, reductase component [Burkholderia thailandensis E264]AHI76768.1 4-hydroxyphenylacetate 3-monooxygenase, reductase component [Burkholderia thailandensis 2002721723]AHI82619.1 4-hydroxyphenylacetate 3-monooxygenase, reductase component [Burkholderia thailandensis E444]AIC90735.1 4-hydroxyphenylacetate 3-monooxygenase, reductase component [Burkholderia thail